MSGQGNLNTKNINPIGGLIARGLALGLSYEDLAIQHGMTTEQVAQIARGNLVKQRVRELMKEIDEEAIANAGASDVKVYLAAKGLSSAKRLVIEMENEDTELGASATTRINAAKTILELGGHSAPKGEAPPVAVIMISGGKAERAEKIANATQAVVHDNVDG